jgi:hypothetical protein
VYTGPAFVLTHQPPEMAADWDRSWLEDPRFRHVMRVITGMWGVAFLLDSALRVVMAFTLPVDLLGNPRHPDFILPYCYRRPAGAAAPMLCFLTRIGISTYARHPA